MKRLWCNLTVMAVAAVVLVCWVSFAAANCPDQTGECVAVPNCPNATCGPQSRGQYLDYGTCFSWTGCKPCYGQDYYRKRCHEKYPGQIVGCNCEDWYYSFRDSSGNEIHN